MRTAPSPAAHALMLHGVLAAWHLALFSALASSGLVPIALPPLPPLPPGDLGLLPRSAGAAVGLVAVALFGAAAAGAVAGAAQEAAAPPAEAGAEEAQGADLQ